MMQETVTAGTSKIILTSREELGLISQNGC